MNFISPCLLCFAQRLLGIHCLCSFYFALSFLRRFFAAFCLFQAASCPLSASGGSAWFHPALTAPLSVSCQHTSGCGSALSINLIISNALRKDTSSFPSVQLSFPCQLAPCRKSTFTLKVAIAS